MSTTAPTPRIVALERHLRGDAMAQAIELLESLTDSDAIELAALEALANILQDEGRITEATILYLRLMVLCPANADVLYNLGNIFRQSGRCADAAEAFGKVTALNPNDFEAFQQLGNMLVRLGRANEALDCYQRALYLNPDFYPALLDLGNALRALGRQHEAIASYQQAVAINPVYPPAQYNLGVGLMEQGRLEEAIECYRRAMALDPRLAEAKWNCAISMLAAGNFDEGWPLFETRLDRGPAAGRRFAAPRWNDEDLEGKDILVHAEQGYGDTLQFVRYISLLVKFCKPRRVFLECQPELKRLLTGMAGVDRVFAGGEDALPAYDFHMPLLSLPLAFKTRLETIPARTPYISAPPELVDKWRARFAGDERIKVGLVWAGRAAHPANARRSIAPHMLLPLTAIEHVTFVSLQKEATRIDARLAACVTDHTAELADFADTAALVSQLDLVISVDTAVAHLAGAMCKRVWLLNAWESEWRWLRGRSDSPWYPSMTLFRQSTPERWDDVLQNVARELQHIASRSHHAVAGKTGSR